MSTNLPVSRMAMRMNWSISCALRWCRSKLRDASRSVLSDVHCAQTEVSSEILFRSQVYSNGWSVCSALNKKLSERVRSRWHTDKELAMQVWARAHASVCTQQRLLWAETCTYILCMCALAYVEACENSSTRMQVISRAGIFMHTDVLAALLGNSRVTSVLRTDLHLFPRIT